MIRKIAIYFTCLVAVFIVLAALDPDGFVFDPKRAGIVFIVMVAGAFALWFRHDWAKSEEKSGE